MNEILVEGIEGLDSLSLSLSLSLFEVILGEFHSINNNVSEAIYEKSKPIYIIKKTKFEISCKSTIKTTLMLIT